MPPILSSASYNDFLINHLPQLLKNVSSNIREQIFYQHDVYFSQHSILVRQTLNDKFLRRWIECNDPIDG